MHCGSDASMSIAHTSKGYVAYCHRCGEKGFEAHGTLSIADLLQRKAVLNEVTKGEIKLPKDFTLDIPHTDALWLLKAGVDLNIARQYGFGYSSYWRRVILPIYNNGEDGKKLVGFTSRSTIGEKPKYLARMKDGQSTLFYADASLALPSALATEALCSIAVVITEDVLSSVRVGRLATSVALLGTSTSDHKASRILAYCNEVAANGRVLCWLDGDSSGKQASREICRTLRLYGLDVKEIRTVLDPKKYSNRDIKEILLQ